jgi:chorismate mutase
MKQLPLVLFLILGHLGLGQTMNSGKESDEKILLRHRQRIDVLDKRIVGLLNERARLALDIGRIRERENIPPSSVRSREEEVLRNAMSNSVAPLSPEASRRIYERIIAEMVAIQTHDRTSQSTDGSKRGQGR